MRTSGNSASLASLAGGAGALLLPKCPLCFAAYGSALGALGLSPAAHQRAAELVLGAVLVLAVLSVGWLSVRRRDALTALGALSGAGLVALGRWGFELPALTLLGGALLVGAALLNAARCRRAHATGPAAPVPAAARAGQ